MGKGGGGGKRRGVFAAFNRFRPDAASGRESDLREKSAAASSRAIHCSILLWGSRSSPGAEEEEEKRRKKRAKDRGAKQSRSCIAQSRKGAACREGRRTPGSRGVRANLFNASEASKQRTKEGRGKGRRRNEPTRIQSLTNLPKSLSRRGHGKRIENA